VVEWTRGEHHAAARGTEIRCAGRDESAAADFVSGAGTTFGDGIAPYFKDWLAHPNFDEYWKQWSIEDHYAQIEVPVLNIAAWYDIFLGGSLKNYVRFENRRRDGSGAQRQRLVVTVGGHAGNRAPEKWRRGVWEQIDAGHG